MHHDLSGLRGIIPVVVIGLSVAACGAAAPGRAPAGATSFDEYATAACSAWGTLFRVVGNPETAGWTDAVHQLQAASAARDQPTAAGLQGQINPELESARVQIAVAAAWAPATRPMAEMDRFFVATETWITAYVDVAKGVPNAPDPQAAFEAAGGVTSWGAIFEGRVPANVATRTMVRGV